MDKRIIYVNDDGQLAIIIPSPEAVINFGIEAIAKKDVPAGRPYKIVSAADLPQDRTFRAAWSVDESILTDGIGSSYFTFEEVKAEIAATEKAEASV